MPMFCDRPHARQVDWTSRFIVASDRGLDLSTGHLERGDLVPLDALDNYTLRCEYELRRIELVSFARDFDTDLREACARRKVSVGATTDGVDDTESVAPIRDAVSTAVVASQLPSESRISSEPKANPSRHKLKK